MNHRTKVTSEPIGRTHAADVLEPDRGQPATIALHPTGPTHHQPRSPLVTELFGINSGTALYYLADSVYDARLLPNT